MPPNRIVVVPSHLYPTHPTYKLSEVGESIFDRYYQSFVGCLQNNCHRCFTQRQCLDPLLGLVCLSRAFASCSQVFRSEQECFLATSRGSCLCKYICKALFE